MSFVMHWDTREVDKWINNQSNRDLAKKQALIGMKEKLVDEVRKEVSTHTTTGKLENNIDGYTYANKLEIRTPMYGDIVLEYGRRPGKMPPVEPLQKWAMLHGMDRSAGYLIARKIAQRGTQKYQKGSPRQITEIEKRFNNTILPKEMSKLLDKYTQ
jgi:hypothetical protein